MSATEEYPPTTATPCSECPWRKKALAGWLGPNTAKEWIRIAHGEGAIACHKTVRKSGDWEGASQCAGAAAFRANVGKRPRNPNIASGPPRDDVFDDNHDFVDYHTDGRESWEIGDMYR